MTYKNEYNNSLIIVAKYVYIFLKVIFHKLVEKCNAKFIRVVVNTSVSKYIIGEEYRVNAFFSSIPFFLHHLK